MADFDRLGVCPEIIQAITEEGWLLPTPVQDEAIPLVLGGGDVCVAAETGSGKTGAFGLPCLQVVHETLQNKAMTCVSTNKAKVQTTKFDVNSKDAMVFIDETGLIANSPNVDKWLGVKCTGDVIQGQYMFEIEIRSEGLVRVGWAASVSQFEIGKDDRSFGYGGTGKISWNRTFTDYGYPFGKGDIIGCLLDRQLQTISFSKNGEDLGKAFTIPPQLHNVALKPAVCGKPFSVKLNPGPQLVYPISGYTPISNIDTNHTLGGVTRELDTAGSGRRRPLCLILEPTRDLAQQTFDCLNHFGKYLECPSLRLGLFVGGVDERSQKESLRTGVDIAVGTLQKMMFYVKKGELNITNVKFLVLDEADDLMKNDERNDIPTLKSRAQSSQKSRVQTLFFSATLHSPEVRSAIDRITVNPIWVDLKGKPSIPDTVHFVCYKVDPTRGQLPFKPPGTIQPQTDGIHIRDHNHGLEGHSQRIKVAKPQIAVAIADKFDMKSCLVFCRTNLDCDNFEAYLIALGGGRGFSGRAETGKENAYSCVVLAGMRSQEERQRNLDYFRSGDVRFLICTDVAARGIDIKELPFLMMLTLPDDPNQFFHRVGRVGRADNMGLAISIVSTQKEKVWYHRCPNRGKGCHNTNLIDQGGCCIWYDEPDYIRQIEERVGSTIAVMDPATFAVPGIIDPPGSKKVSSPTELGRRNKSSGLTKEGVISQKQGQMLMYGKSKNQTTDKLTLKHLNELASSVDELRNLEKEAQQNYVSLLDLGLKKLQ